LISGNLRSVLSSDLRNSRLLRIFFFLFRFLLLSSLWCFFYQVSGFISLLFHVTCPVIRYLSPFRQLLAYLYNMLWRSSCITLTFMLNWLIVPSLCIITYINQLDLLSCFCTDSVWCKVNSDRGLFVVEQGQLKINILIHARMYCNWLGIYFKQDCYSNAG